MDHDHDLSTELEGFLIASFLVGAITSIFFMDKDPQAQSLCQFHSPILAAIIAKDNLINPVPRNISDSPFQRLDRIISRQNDNIFLFQKKLFNFKLA